ncbi:MAG: hypothetical protein SNH27_15900 [Rikenellaceae bacterium]
MAQPKGKTGNPNGRPKGSPNKVTTEMKEWVKELIDNNREQLERDLKILDPDERWRVIEKLMSYVMPKMQSVETKIDLNNLTDDQLNAIVGEITKGIDDEDTDNT